MSVSALGSRAIVGTFFRRLEEQFDGAWWSPLAFQNNSDQQYEEYRFSDQVPTFTKWTGQRAGTTLGTKFVRVTNETWNNVLDVSVDDLRRDKTGQIMVRVNEIADRFAYLMDERITTLITQGDSTTGFAGTAYDDQQYFDTDHSEGSSGTLQNNIDSSDVAALNVSTAADPTQAEASAILLNVIAYMMTYKDDKGEPMNGGARQFLALLPTNLWGAFLGAAKKDLLEGSSGTVRDNLLKQTDFGIDVRCNPRLDADSTTVGYLFRTDGNTKPFIVQEEVGVTMDSRLAEGSEYAIENRMHRYISEWTGGFGYGQWQYAVRFTLS
jgi:phage major head subunit gpT-like protein